MTDCEVDLLHQTIPKTRRTISSTTMKTTRPIIPPIRISTPFPLVIDERQNEIDDDQRTHGDANDGYDPTIRRRAGHPRA